MISQTPITERNEFFNPDDFDHTVHGFYEKIWDKDTGKSYGRQDIVGLPQRPIGSPGLLCETMTAPFTTLKMLDEKKRNFASPSRPKTIYRMIELVGGRKKKDTTYYQHHETKK